ncbi:DNA replication factor Dna2-domain-containing protein [Halteromyces radiatus]|uniref:DNA replication factor Dna2-domain-containing protein n=1 Tax=Halteromyces radiatus TaxID=101107 RepID=UPI0022204A56|nr:DNA replication factor Dna2-domain-containing protein [Halteromyces radiatus]KAI8089992.1 DNA replication factor Dna2-domain-containing protein [Halteromyces radiatus]
MFGDDIPSALLDEVLNVSQKQPPAPIAMDHVQNEANIMIGHLPQQQQQQQQQQLQQKQHDASSINKENFNYDDDDDMFGDDIPIEDLEEQLGMGRDISVPSGSGLPTINREGLDATLETKFETSDSCSNIKDTATGQRNNSRSRYQRFIIVATRLKGYMVDDSQRLERELLLVGEEHEQVTKAYLRQDWLHIRVAEGDAINIVFTNRNGHTKNNWIIDNEQNYLIHHPDHLISCTAVAESFFCLRKSVLQMTSKSISEVSEPLIHGAIIHETLQYCLKQKDFTTTAIQNAMKTIIKSTLDPLYVIGQDETTTYELLTPHITSIQTFGSIYVRQYPIPAATIKRDIGPSDTECSSLAIRDILDIEEHIWSPIYGLKGMIDATVEMILAPNNKVLTLPFELKTGRASRLISHRAQTILYTLLLGDRYDFDVNVGVLYYSKTNSLYMVPASQSEIRSLIIARNELSAAYQRQATALPPMIKNFHSCQYCTMNDACTLYHKTVESGSAMTSGLGQWFNDHTDHINDKAAIFYRQWIQLISLEEQDLDYLRKDIWNDSAKERELSDVSRT